jgi:hypothetical protein
VPVVTLQIEGNADNSLEVLAALDTVKMSMEKCSSILVEAEKLKRLSEDVDNVFRTNDFRRVRAPSCLCVCVCGGACAVVRVRVRVRSDQCGMMAYTFL